MKKNAMSFKFEEPVVDALKEESEKTGKTMTRYISDAITVTGLFSEPAREQLELLSKRAKLPPRRVLEELLLSCRKTSKEGFFENPSNDHASLTVAAGIS